MLSAINKSKFTAFLFGFIGLLLLNVSIDTTDFNSQILPEDLSINDQESIVELVVEKVLGYDNAIREFDDDDSDESNKKKSMKIDLTIQNENAKPEHKNSVIHNSKRQHFYYTHQLRSTFLKVESPPPNC